VASPAAPLRLRVASALVMVPVALGLTLLGSWPFALLVAAVLVAMAIEWRQLTRSAFAGRDGTLAAGAALALALVAVLLGLLGHAGTALAVLLLGAAASWLIGVLAGGASLWPPLGVLYLGLPGLALIWLRGLPEIGVQVLVWLLIVVWATDIVAYFAGRGLGGPRLAPVISPGKTWAGLLGGMLGAGLAGIAAAALVGSERLLQAGGLGAVLAIVAQLGDLAESALKRRAGVKDSGGLIPGHGGVLDRIDGLVFAAPALALSGLLLRPGLWPWP